MIDRDALLKGGNEEENIDHFGDEDEEESLDYDEVGSSGGGGLFLGMTPVERMFISIFLFMNVTVLGVALLLATGRIQF